MIKIAILIATVEVAVVAEVAVVVQDAVVTEGSHLLRGLHSITEAKQFHPIILALHRKKTMHAHLLAKRVLHVRTIGIRYISKKQSRLQAFSPQYAIDGVDELPRLAPHEMSIVQRLFKPESKLITSTKDTSDLPEWDIPEIAFAGRSNVGKSSLINAVVGQPGLVRTSKTPGRTQQLHFYSIGGKIGSLPTLALVDMPGYGFANVPKSVADAFHALVGGYVQERRTDNLKTVFLLVDARRGITTVDESFMDYLFQLGALYQVVLTKADAVTPTQLIEVIEHAKQVATGINRMSMNPIIHVTSTKERFGIREIQHQIIRLSRLLPSTL